MARPSILSECEHVFVMDYVELHCHSAFSFLDGASLPEELVAAAVERGHEALALTDHDSVSGSMELAQAAKALGLRAIHGAEVDRGRTASGATRPRPAPHAARARRARVAQPLPAADPRARAHAATGSAARRPRPRRSSRSTTWPPTPRGSSA